MRSARTLAGFAAQLNCAARPEDRRPALPRLWLLSDAQRLPDPGSAIQRLPAGAGFIFRHYEYHGRESLARQLLLLCRKRRIIFLLAGDWRMALRVGADGVHLPEQLGHQARAIRNVRPNALVMVAAHSARAISRACQQGADAILLSPVFATASHPGAAALGAVRFAKLRHGARLPVIALGGINPHTARRLRGSGAAGIAAIGGLA